MPSQKPSNPADYIEPLYMNGLRGRMLRIKSKPQKSKEILVVYGQHSSLERIFGMAESLNRYGSVTVPDLPGFGGMQNFYRLKEKPNIDNMADYLAAFMKLRYKNRRVTIIGISYGFAVVTRVLQRYPELTKKVDLLISTVGFVHRDDFNFNKFNYFVLRYGAGIFSHRFTSLTAKHFFLRPSFIRALYSLSSPKKSKFKSKKDKNRESQIAYEIHLWKTNDLRTYMYTTNDMLKLDLCNKQVNLPVHHITLKNDQYLKNDFVEQHLGVIYKKVFNYSSKLPAHMPTLASSDEAAKLLPPKLRKLLAKQ